MWHRRVTGSRLQARAAPGVGCRPLPRAHGVWEVWLSLWATHEGVYPNVCVSVDFVANGYTP